MGDSLGLSVGTTNLVAAPQTGVPTVRRAVLTLFPHRPPEVGTPSENPSLNERGLVLSGFVERVGDPVPLVASDGSTHRGERLVADALEALIRSARRGRPVELIGAAVPAHWRPVVIDSLRAALSSNAILSPQGRSLPLTPDSAAALTALRAQPGLPARGVVALCDFGATGTSITLADAAAGFRNIGPTVRFEDFSGELIDQAILRHVLAELDVDPSNTSAVVELTRVREQCRTAKEQLSFDTATGFTAPLPGPHSTVRVTRGELEALIRDPLEGVITVVEETLQRNNIARTALVALATMGGGARIPLVTQRLSEALRLPVTTTSQPEAIAAVGAALMARRGPEDRAATGLATLAPAAAAPDRPAPRSEPLAWSEEQPTDDVVPAAFSDYGYANPWYRHPGVIVGATAAAVFTVVLGVFGVWWLTKPDASSSQGIPASTTVTRTRRSTSPSNSKLLGLTSNFASDQSQPIPSPSRQRTCRSGLRRNIRMGRVGHHYGALLAVGRQGHAG